MALLKEAKSSLGNAAVNPLRHDIAIVRGILLKGVGLEALWIHVLALACFAAILLTMSAKRFRSQL